MDELIKQLASLSQAVNRPFTNVARFIEPHLPDYMRSYQPPAITENTPPGKVGPGEMNPFEKAIQLGLDIFNPAPGMAAAVSIPIKVGGKTLANTGVKTFKEAIKPVMPPMKAISPEDPTTAAMIEINRLLNSWQSKPIPQHQLDALKQFAAKSPYAEIKPARSTVFTPEEAKALDELEALAHSLGIKVGKEYLSQVTPSEAKALANTYHQAKPGSMTQYNKIIDLNQILNPKPSTLFPTPSWSFLPEDAYAMGFTTPAFHGTKSDVPFSAFTYSPYDLGAHFGTPKAAADRLGMTSSPIPISEAKAGARVYPSVLRTGNPLDLPDLGSWDPSTLLKGLEETKKFSPQSIEAAHGAGMQGYRDLLTSQGFDSIRYVNKMEDPGSISYLMFKNSLEDPNFIGGIRSPFARFSNMDSPNIMASLAALGLVGLPAAGMLKNNGQQ